MNATTTPASAPGGDSSREPTEGTSDSRSPIRQLSLRPPRRTARNSDRRRRRGLLIGLLTALGAAIVLGGVGVATWPLITDSEEQPVEETSVPDSFAGTWSGQMVQEEADGDHVIDWNTEIKLEGGAERGSSEWTTMNCRGTLTLAERVRDRMVFDYVETYDPEDNCVDEAELTLWQGDAAEEIEARWKATSHTGTSMISTGTLR